MATLKSLQREFPSLTLFPSLSSLKDPIASSPCLTTYQLDYLYLVPGFYYILRSHGNDGWVVWFWIPGQALLHSRVPSRIFKGHWFSHALTSPHYFLFSLTRQPLYLNLLHFYPSFATSHQPFISSPVFSYIYYLSIYLILNSLNILILNMCEYLFP